MTRNNQTSAEINTTRQHFVQSTIPSVVQTIRLKISVLNWLHCSHCRIIPLQGVTTSVFWQFLVISILSLLLFQNRET